MKILSKSDIKHSIDGAKIVGALRAAYAAMSRGDVQLPPVGYLSFPGNNGDCHVKFGHILGDPIFVVKVATGFYSNPSLGLPTGNGVVLAISATTGEIAAVLQDEGLLTDLRTGYGGAIATQALARADARRVAIIGTGVQARCQIRAHAEVLAARAPEFSVWGRSLEKSERLASELRSEGIAVSPAPDAEEICRSSEIIVTATQSASPIVMADWIAPGTHITAIGADAPGKQELASALVRKADVVVADHIGQCLDHGELSHSRIDPEDIVELGHVLNGAAIGRSAFDQITIADLTGVAVQDVAITQAVLAFHSGNLFHQPQTQGIL